MKKIIWVGSIIFLIGLIMQITYSIYPLYIDNEQAMLGGMRFAFVLMGVGAVVLLISLGFERYKGHKKFKKDIKQEDLEP